MTSSNKPQGDQLTARALGLKVSVFRHLRDSLSAGEHPAWLQQADPAVAGSFPSPLGFELLLDGLAAEGPLSRRRANLIEALNTKELTELVGLAEAAADEGTLEDINFALHPSVAPEGLDAPEKEEHQKFLETLRGDVKLAMAARKVFRQHAILKVTAIEGKEGELRPFKQFVDQEHKIDAFPASSYLQLRRGEHAHVIKVDFEVAQPEIDALFSSEVEAPPQERESYLKLFRNFYEQERKPRFIQEARAKLKRLAESSTLEHAWNHAHLALDRGKQDGFILGVCSQRSGKVQLALLNHESAFVRGCVVSPKAETFKDELNSFIGEDLPQVLALQADSPTRNHGGKVVDHLRSLAKEKKEKLRQVLVPVAVVRTLLREVARRLEDSHLTHDERQALMLARMAHCPRAAVLHTPHIVRAFVAGRSEVNPHRLDTFEQVFIQSLLVVRGVDVNTSTHDELKAIPGIDAVQVEIERSTGPFHSLVDFQNRIGLSERDWRVAMCFLRCRNGEEQLDSRNLHPVYYSALRRALATQEGLTLADLLKTPEKVLELTWDDILEENSWHERIPHFIRRSITRGGGRRPRMHVNKGGRLEGVEIGKVLKGKVVRLTEIGAFVNVGLRKDGFVHISQLADQFVKDPAEAVEVGQEVVARVLSVDLEKQRLRLSLKSEEESGEGRKGGGGKGGARKGRGQREEPSLPAFAVNSRPKSRPGGGKGRRDDDRGKKKERVKLGKDPQADRWKEDIDPTNPFFQFFNQEDGDAKK